MQVRQRERGSATVARGTFAADLTSGWEIGRNVGEAVVARAKADGS